jgi:chromosomal replication initiator protein
MRTMAKTARTAWVPAQFVPLLENRSALLAIRRLAHRLSRCPFFPLFLHGPPGTGKTHLANALHEHVAERADVHRVSAANWNPEESDRLRCDLLIVEDLQHLPAAMIEELIATLDARLPRKQATLLTANKGPAELSEIPARLANRLGCGLVIGLETLAPESRVSLLGNLAKQRNLGISSELIRWLVDHTPGSARQLAAALARWETLAAGLSRPLEIADLAVGFERRAKADAETIARHVAQAYDVKLKALRGRDRHPQLLWPRHVSMYLTRRLTDLSLAQIGEYYARDHSTVRHAVQKIGEALAIDPELPGLLRKLESELN